MKVGVSNKTAGYVYLLPNWVPSFVRSSWSPIHARTNYYLSDEPKEEWEKGNKAMTNVDDAKDRFGRSKATGESP